MFTSPCYRINGKSVSTLNEKVETSTALIVTSQDIKLLSVIPSRQEGSLAKVITKGHKGLFKH